MNLNTNINSVVLKKNTFNTENAGDMGLIPGSGTSPGGGHGNPLRDSCLENSMDRGAWQATVQYGCGVGRTRAHIHACSQKISGWKKLRNSYLWRKALGEDFHFLFKIIFAMNNHYFCNQK